jgi:hypothetical protein
MGLPVDGYLHGMSERATLLLGTHTFAASGDAARRQADCVASIRALTGVAAVNVQFADAPHVAEGIETLAALTKDSRAVSGRTEGRRKAIVREMLDVLAAEARRRGCGYFCFTNADIIWSQAAVDWIRREGREAYALSRLDFDGETGADAGVELSGVDAIAMRPEWYQAHAHRFRDYIVGEICWDNVYTAILMCHADAAIENRRGLLRHERHPSGPAPSSAFGDYTSLLAAIDAEYFHMWCRYWGRLEACRARGAPAEEEARLARELFVWRPAWYAPALRLARRVRARLRYASSRLAIQ